jgi:alkylation response protein AidB-like acyl-CoA dehydrogenase
MTVQLLPSPAVEEALEVLGALIRGRLPHDPNDAFFKHDWSGLWHELAEGGWTSLADGEAPGRDGDFSLLDLTAVAETWGGYLVPLPLMATLAVRRWGDGHTDPAQRLSFVAAEGTDALVVHGEATDAVASGAGLVARSALGAAASVDDWAASLPISVLAGAAAAPAGLRRDAAILAASEAVGAAAMVVRRSIDYAKLREQFGRPIGTFQAVKHSLANLHCNVELSRSAIAWAVAEPDGVPAATRAVFEHCLRIAEGCVQVHGGIGYTWEAPVHRYYRHVMSLRRVAAAAAWGG